jgi:Uma2 family endonuclease
MNADPAYRSLTADEFLTINFGPDRKAELDRGMIRMMAGGTAAHARLQANMIMALGPRLRGTGCRPYGSDMAIRTGDWSVRYPDVSVICGDPGAVENDRKKALTDARVIVEILSESTAVHDQEVKLQEYQALASVDTILFIDPDSELCRVIQRLGPTSWRDDRHQQPTDIDLPSLAITLPHAEIFARD